MTIQEYGFENGTDGAAITAALIGGTIGGANHGHFSAAAAMHGSLGVAWLPSEKYYWAGWPASAAQIAVRFYVKLTSDCDITNASIFNLNNGETRLIGVSYVSDKGLYAIDSGNATIGGDGNWITGSIPLGTWYRCELVADLAAGSASLSVYAGDSTTPLGTKASASGLTFSQTTATTVRVGVPSAAAWTTGSVYHDDVAWNAGGTAEIGPAGAPPVSSSPVVRGVISGGVELAASVRGVISGGVEKAAAVQAVVGGLPPAGGGNALPATFPITLA